MTKPARRSVPTLSRNKIRSFRLGPVRSFTATRHCSPFGGAGVRAETMRVRASEASAVPSLRPQAERTTKVRGSVEPGHKPPRRACPVALVFGEALDQPRLLAPRL